MPSVSKAQQRFMGMVHATQKGDMDSPSPEVSKAANSMSDKDAKDFASTSHKGLPDKKTEQLNKIREIVRKMVRERMIDEMNTTGNIEGYNTPYAFSGKDSEEKKGKKQADLTGYTVVKESLINEWKLQLDLRNVNPSEFENWADSSLQKKHKIKISGSGKNWIIVGKGNDDRMGSSADWITQLLGKAWTNNKIKVVQKESVNEALINNNLQENRWLALKQDESTAQSKIGRGISNINKQLREMERFLNWYGKIKNESGVSNKSYWKRTNSHIYSIQERLLKLDQKIRQISE